MYHQTHRKVPHRQGLDDAVQLLIGKAIFESPEEEVFIRTAPYNGMIIVDLTNNQGQAVEISQSGWKIIATAPVNFLRLQSQRPMPLPLPGGTLNDLRPFINARSDEDFFMTVAFLIFTLHPKGPFPALVINGDPGSCKSTGVHMLKNIVDPSTSVNFTSPKNVRDVFVNAAKTWLVTYDNLSEIPKWLSNCFCRISTGASHGTKKLYTDGDEYQLSVRRPIVLSGIGDLITRGDLASRAISVQRKSIENTPAMRTEEEIWQQFELKHPYLLGWIFDGLSAGLRNLSLINENYPRMADFSRFIAAADREIWTPGTFNKAYRSNMSKLVKQMIDADPITSSVIAMMRNQTDCRGTAEEALKALSAHVTNPRILISKHWPQAPNKLRGFLENSQNLLNKEGIEIEFDILENGKRLLRIFKPTVLSDAPILPESNDINAPDAPIITVDDSVCDYAPNTNESPKPIYEDMGISPDGKYWTVRTDSGVIKFKISKEDPEERAKREKEIEDDPYTYKSIFEEE
jgi:hypothetical protein